MFSTRLTRAREEVTEITENRVLSYRLLSGLPLRNYRAKVALAPIGDGGTHIVWSARFGPQPWGTRTFWRIAMTRLLQTMVRDLAAAATHARVPDAAIRSTQGVRRGDVDEIGAAP